MEPTIKGYIEDVQKTKELVDQIKQDNNNEEAKKELAELSKKVEKAEYVLLQKTDEELKTMAKKELIKHGRAELLQVQKERQESMKNVDISAELEDLKQTAKKQKITKKNEKSEFWSLSKILDKKERKENTGRNLARTGAAIGGVMAIKRARGKLFGSKDKKEENKKEEEGFFSKIRKYAKWPIGIGAGLWARDKRGNGLKDFLGLDKAGDKKKDNRCLEVVKDDRLKGVVTYNKKENEFFYDGGDDGLARGGLTFKDKEADIKKILRRKERISKKQTPILKEEKIKDKLKNNAETQKQYNSLAENINTHQKNIGVDSVQLGADGNETIDGKSCPGLYVAQLDVSRKKLSKFTQGGKIKYIKSLHEKSRLDSIGSFMLDGGYGLCDILSQYLPEGENIVTQYIEKGTRKGLNNAMEALDPAKRREIFNKLVAAHNKYVAIIQYSRDMQEMYEVKKMKEYLTQNDTSFDKKTSEQQQVIALQKLRDNTYYQTAKIAEKSQKINNMSLLDIAKSLDKDISYARENPIIHNGAKEAIEEIEIGHQERKTKIDQLTLGDKEGISECTTELIDDMRSDGYQKRYAPFQAVRDQSFADGDKMFAQQMQDMREDKIGPMEQTLITINDKIEKGLPLEQNDLHQLKKIEQKYTNFKKEAMQSIKIQQADGDNGENGRNTAGFVITFTLGGVTQTLRSEATQGEGVTRVGSVAILLAPITLLGGVLPAKSMTGQGRKIIMKGLTKINPVAFTTKYVRNIARSYTHIGFGRANFYERLITSKKGISNTEYAKELLLYDFSRGKINTNDMHTIIQKLNKKSQINIKMPSNINLLNPDIKTYEKIMEWFLDNGANQLDTKDLEKLAEIAQKNPKKLQEIIQYKYQSEAKGVRRKIYQGLDYFLSRKRKIGKGTSITEAIKGKINKVHQDLAIEGLSKSQKSLKETFDSKIAAMLDDAATSGDNTYKKTVTEITEKMKKMKIESLSDAACDGMKKIFLTVDARQLTVIIDIAKHAPEGKIAQIMIETAEAIRTHKNDDDLAEKILKILNQEGKKITSKEIAEIQKNIIFKQLKKMSDGGVLLKNTAKYGDEALAILKTLAKAL